MRSFQADAPPLRGASAAFSFPLEKFLPHGYIVQYSEPIYYCDITYKIIFAILKQWYFSRVAFCNLVNSERILFDVLEVSQ